MIRKPAFMCECFTCGSQFQFGLGIYDGQHVAGYDFTVCRTCFSSNWDGWAPHYEAKIVAHLSDKGLPIPDRNEAGWLPRTAK